MKNVIYLIVSLLFCSQFSLDAQTRQQPVTKSNGHPSSSCVGVRVIENEGHLNILSPSIVVNTVWNELEGDNPICEAVFQSLHAVAFYYHNGARVVVGSRALSESSLDGGELLDFPQSCLDEYGSSLVYGEMLLWFDQSNFPAPSGICDNEEEPFLFLDVMYYDGVQFIPLSELMQAPKAAACLLQLFPQSCFWNPANWSPAELETCIWCYASLEPVGGKFGQSNSKLSEMTLEAAPNPFVNDLTVRVHTLNAGNGTIEMFDLQGRRFRQQTVQLSAGANEISMSTDDLAEGIYFLRLKSNETLQTVKIVKRNP